MIELFHPHELLNLPWLEQQQSTLWRVCILLCNGLLREVVEPKTPDQARKFVVDILDNRDLSTFTTEEQQFDLRYIRHSVILNNYKRLDEFTKDVNDALTHHIVASEPASEVILANIDYYHQCRYYYCDDY